MGDTPQGASLNTASHDMGPSSSVMDGDWEFRYMKSRPYGDSWGVQIRHHGQKYWEIMFLKDLSLPCINFFPQDIPDIFSVGVELRGTGII